jgi:hypothetical protein
MDNLLLYFVAVLQQIDSHKIVDQGADLGGRYWDRTSDLFGVKEHRGVRVSSLTYMKSLVERLSDS